MLLFFSILVTTQNVSALPDLDGIISDEEWSAGRLKNIEMGNGEILKLITIYTLTNIYFLATILHEPPNVIQIDDLDLPHDYFGIEFDINKDDIIMGTESNRDDMVLVDYKIKGAVDMYSHTYHVYEDTINNGVNDAEGSSGQKDDTLIWELKKPLDSKDKNGFDISLKVGDEYNIMIAFWDNKYPRTSATYVNKQKGNTQFITMTVGPPIDPTVGEIIGGIMLLSSFGLSMIAIKYGSDPVKLKNIITKVAK